MDKARLRSILALHGDTVSDLAHLLCLTPQSVYYKMNETVMSSGRNAEFTQGEIRRIKDHYNLTSDEIEAIFFK